jgi:hypothetical protein
MAATTDTVKIDEFYEAMPATADSFAFGANPSADESDHGQAYDDDRPTDDGRMLALITLMLVALVAVALGMLFLRGIDAVKGAVPAGQQQTLPQNAPQPNDSSGTLEM